MSQKRYTLRVGAESQGCGADDGQEQPNAINDWSRLVLGSILPGMDFFRLLGLGFSETILDVIGLQQKQMLELFQQQEQQLVDALRKSIESLSDDVCESQIKLANRGWFPDPDMSFGELRQIAEAIETNPDAVDEHMQASFQAKLDEIETELLRKHPSRAHLLQDAFSAHRDAKYTLSIPVLFSQADGICYDSFKKNIFITYKRKKIHIEAKSESEELASSFSLPLLSETLPLWVTERERGESFQGLNRHEVLHGISVDYNTETDSLKAVSFISWLSWLLGSLHSDEFKDE